MPSDIERATSRSLGQRQQPTVSGRRQVNKTAKALAAIDHRTVVGVTLVQSDGFIQEEKVRELDRLGLTAMVGQGMLRGFAKTIAGPDPESYDDMRFFMDTVKLGKGEIIVRTIECFAREC